MGPCGLPQLKNRRESGGLGTGLGGGEAAGSTPAAENNGAVALATRGGLPGPPG